MGKRCAAPLDICMAFNATADSLTRHGIARKADAAECLDLLGLAREHHLVQLGENVQRRVSFICNAAAGEEGRDRRGAVPRLRRLRERLPSRSHRTRLAPGARSDSRGFRGPGGHDGHRTGKAQHLIFDRQAGESPRAMAAVLGVILKLPPVKKAMTSRQFKSRYLEALIKRSLHARRR